METITTFLATTPMVIFLVPVILILVVLLVVLNKTHPAEVVPEVPVPPVTTTPSPASEGEVVSQEIKPVTEQSVVVEHVSAPEPVVSHGGQQQVQQSAESDVATPVIAHTDSVPVSAPISSPEMVVEAQVVPPVASWHPQESVVSIEESTKVTEMEVTTPLNQEISSVTEQVPIISDTISPQAVATEVIESAPLVQEESSILSTTPPQAV